MKAVAVCFFDEVGSKYNPKNYYYKTNIDFAEGDMAVVKVGEIYKIVKIMKVLEGEHEKATKFIVCKVDISEYEKMVALEEKRKDLFARMEKLSESSSKLKTFEVLAQADPEMFKLLSEYKALVE